MERVARKTKFGVVISDKMDKTIVVKVEKRVQHAKYRKTILRSIRFKAHDETNECKVGDVVSIMETRPLSKDKQWRVIKVLERTQIRDSAGE